MNNNKNNKKSNSNVSSIPLNLKELQKHLDNNEHLFSYKQLCDILNDDYKKNSGNSKKNQIQFWSNFFDLKHIGYKYEITEIYDTPLKTMEELNVRLKSHPEFLVPFESRNSSGIYKIYNDDYIYFGSTVEFRTRFRCHLKGDQSTQMTLKNIDILHNNGFFDMVEKCILIDRDNAKDITFINDSPLSISIEERLKNINNNSSFNDNNIRICSCKTMRDLELYYIHKYYFDQLEHNFQPPFHRKLINSVGIIKCKKNINNKSNIMEINQKIVNKEITTSISLNFLIENPTIKQLYADFINNLKSNLSDSQINDFFKSYTKNTDLLFDNFDYNISSKEVLVYE